MCRGYQGREYKQLLTAAAAFADFLPVCPLLPSLPHSSPPLYLSPALQQKKTLGFKTLNLLLLPNLDAVPPSMLRGYVTARHNTVLERCAAAEAELAELKALVSLFWGEGAGEQNSRCFGGRRYSVMRCHAMCCLACGCS